MGTLPKIGLDIRDYTEPMLSPSYTYRVDLDNDRIAGYVDYEKALEQAIILALNTPKGKYEIYPDDYGIDMNQLIGVSPSLAKVRAPFLIKECLEKDLRIESVEVTDVECVNNELHCRVICNGNIEVTMQYVL